MWVEKLGLGTRVVSWWGGGAAKLQCKVKPSRPQPLHVSLVFACFWTPFTTFFEQTPKTFILEQKFYIGVGRLSCSNIKFLYPQYKKKALLLCRNGSIHHFG